MAIIEKSIKIILKNGSESIIQQIENGIMQAGLVPVRWAIVDVRKNEVTILANGVQKGATQASCCTKH